MAKTMTTERKLNKKLLSAAGIILVLFGVLFSCVLSASAAEERGSLTLQCGFTVEGGRRVLSGDEYSLAKIADVTITESSVVYTTLPQFENFDCRWQDQTSSVMNGKAKALANYCEKNRLYIASAVTDVSGEVKFEDLTLGLYLIARTKPTPGNKDFVTDPLLVFIPQSVNGEVVYDVVSSPKFSYSSSGNSEIDREPPDGTLPQTGQLMWPVTLLAVLGCFMIIGGSALLRKEGLREKKAR